jgi:hypothetical protein
MSKAKHRNTLFWIALVVSYLSAASYFGFLFPSIAESIYGDISKTAYAYWLISGVIFISSLIGVTYWKRTAMYYLIGICAADAIAASVLLQSTQDTVFNVVLASLWLIIARQHWHSFE